MMCCKKGTNEDIEPEFEMEDDQEEVYVEHKENAQQPVQLSVQQITQDSSVVHLKHSDLEDDIFAEAQMKDSAMDVEELRKLQKVLQLDDDLEINKSNALTKSKLNPAMLSVDHQENKQQLKPLTVNVLKDTPQKKRAKNPLQMAELSFRRPSSQNKKQHRLVLGDDWVQSYNKIPDMHGIDQNVLIANNTRLEVKRDLEQQLGSEYAQDEVVIGSLVEQKMSNRPRRRKTDARKQFNQVTSEIYEQERIDEEIQQEYLRRKQEREEQERRDAEEMERMKEEERRKLMVEFDDGTPTKRKSELQMKLQEQMQAQVEKYKQKLLEKRTSANSQKNLLEPVKSSVQYMPNTTPLREPNVEELPEPERTEALNSAEDMIQQDNDSDECELDKAPLCDQDSQKDDEIAKTVDMAEENIMQPVTTDS